MSKDVLSGGTPGSRPRSELTLAVAFGVAIALSPLSTANRLVPSLLGGIAAAIGLFVYRALLRRAVEPEGSTPATRSPSSESLPHAIKGPVIVLFGLTCLPAAIALWPWYRDGVWQHTHAFVLPFLILSVAVPRVKRARFDPSLGSGWGLVPLAVGLACLVLDLGIQSLHLSVVGAALAAFALVLLFFGPTTARSLAPPIAMLLFFLPLPAGLSRSLSMANASATGAHALLEAIGMPLIRSNATLFIDATAGFGVSARCSGFGTLYAATALIVTLAFQGLALRRVALLSLLAWPITIAANALRLTLLLGFCVWRGIDPNRTAVHGLSGILAAAFVFGVLLLFAGAPARRRLVLP